MNYDVRKIMSDPACFEEFYNHYFPKIYNYVFFRVYDRDIADDICSRIFLKFIDKIDTYNSERGSLQTWLFTIAHNEIVDYIRKKKKRKEIPLELVENKESNKMDIETRVLKNEEEEELYQAFKKLKEREKNILALKFWGELKNREIAGILDLTESNTGVIIYRTVRKLRSMLNVGKVV